MVESGRGLVVACCAVTVFGCYQGAGSGDSPDQAEEGAQGTDGDGSGSEGAGEEGGPAENRCDDLELDPGAPLARRLTPWEYINVVSDTLDVDIRDAVDATWPTELRAAGFGNTANALIVSFAHVEAFSELGATVAEAVDWDALLDEHASCTAFEATCERDFVASLGAKVFRRPLADETVANFARPFAKAQQQGEDFEAGAKLVVRAMLNSARFLYRLEAQSGPDGVRALDGYEMASRLSFLVWGSSPDDQLYGLAEQGGLTTEQEIAEQVDRMLADPKAEATSLRYVRDWLALDDLDTIVRDPEHFEGFDAELAQEMKRETMETARQLIWLDRAPLQELLTANYTVASSRLAEFYGLTAQGEGMNRYDLSDAPQRLGLLTHASVLAISGGSEANMVGRGLFMLRNVLCSEVPPPPPGVDASPMSLEPGKTRRTYSEARMDNPACSGCHHQFDPMAHAFEPFDGVGAFSLEDEHGNPLRMDSELLVPKSAERLEWETTEEFIAALADTDAVAECMVRKPIQFAIGRPLERNDPHDDCAVDEIRSRYESAGGTYQALVTAIATHPSFRVIRGQ